MFGIEPKEELHWRSSSGMSDCSRALLMGRDCSADANHPAGLERDSSSRAVGHVD